MLKLAFSAILNTGKIYDSMCLNKKIRVYPRFRKANPFYQRIVAKFFLTHRNIAFRGVLTMFHLE